VAALDRAGPEAVGYAATNAWRAALQYTRAGAVLVTSALASDSAHVPAAIIVDDPARAMARVALALYPPAPAASGIHPSARIGRGARLGADVTLAAGVVIGRDVQLGARCCLGPGVVLEEGAELGEDCVLDAHVVIYARARLGRRVRVKAGTVLGGEGFGFHSSASGHERVPQVGGLLIGDDVEIGSGCTVDRGSVGDTEIGPGTKVDNLVHIGHNTRIGSHCVLAGGNLVAGSVTLGDFVILGGASGIVDHVIVGDRARIGAATLVTRNVPPGDVFSGYPGRPHRTSLRVQAAALRLPAIIAELERLAHGPDRG
jgi:UDP-3-O-[3-hydroxymyristoyl] glucosamine N-acyltransferase